MPTVSAIEVPPQECPGSSLASYRRDSIPLDSLPIAALTATRDWKVLCVNSAWEELTGWTRESLIGSRFHDWVQPVDGIRLDRFSASSKQPSGAPWDIAVRRNGGGWIWMDLALRWQSGDESTAPHFLCILTDVSDYHRSNDQLRHALEREREAHRKTNEFVAMISHEFKLPVANIGYAAELLRDSADRLSVEKRKRYHHLIQENTVRLNRLADQLILSGQIESGHWRANPVDSELRQFCASVVAEFEPPNEEKSRIRLLTPDFEVWAKIDPLLLRVSLTNLVSNALKYSPVDSEVAVRLDSKSPHIDIEVSDQGIGIRAEDANRLFSPFQRGSNVGTIKGNGIGLAITRTCVALQGGTLEWHRGLGGETCFTIRLSSELQNRARE